ncbi:MAG: biopolymer transporter ExbD [Gallionellaceae bacterium]
MNFQRGRTREEPEINLIPMIDVLLVILIFLMITTTYTKFSVLQIDLPQAEGDTSTHKGNQISVSVDAAEHYAINDQAITFSDVPRLAEELHKAAGDQANLTIVINADAKATHQSVINIMRAAQLAGIGSITFTTRK